MKGYAIGVMHGIGYTILAKFGKRHCLFEFWLVGAVAVE